MTNTANASSHPSPADESRKACAVPWNEVVIVDGNCRLRSVRSMAVIAWLSASAGARLNERLTDGTWPECVTTSGATSDAARVTSDNGTTCPVALRTYSVPSAAGESRNSGATSRITQYWLVDV